MREEMKDIEVNDVHGGSVLISQPMNCVGFTHIGEIYKLQGDCFKQARNRLYQLLDEFPDMSAAAFDAMVRDEFLEAGWIKKK